MGIQRPSPADTVRKAAHRSENQESSLGSHQLFSPAKGATVGDLLLKEESSKPASRKRDADKPVADSSVKSRKRKGKT